MDLSHPNTQKHENLSQDEGRAVFDWMWFDAELRQYVSYRMKGVEASVVDDIVQEVAIVATSHSEKKICD